MKAINLLSILAYSLSVLLVNPVSILSQTYTLSGRVYSGTTGQDPPSATAIPNVTVKLWASNNSGEKQEFVGGTTTNSSGWYGLILDVGDYARDYFIIEEIDPNDYTSDGATSVGGTVLSSNLIQYTFGDLSGTLTGNKFWDKPDNEDPVADAGGPYSGSTGQSVTLDGSGSYDSDGSISTYEWDLNGDGDYNDPGDKTGQTVQNSWGSAGTYTVNLRVTDNNGATDTDQATVTISSVATLVPDIDVLGNGISIPDGDVTPVTADGTDRGLVTLGGSDTMLWFTVKNTGTAVLNLSGVSLSGSGDFSVNIMPASSVAVGDQTHFNIHFIPTALGIRSATVNIANNSAKNPYDFAIQGTVIPVEPDIDVKGNGISIPDGDMTPSTADGTDFGLVHYGATDSYYYVIENTGVAPLTLTSIIISGSSDFQLDYSPVLPKTIAVSDKTGFCIKFTASAAPGVRSATVNIGNNTTAKNPYDFMIQGTVWGESPQDEWDFGDAPDPTYPTLLASNGARHVIKQGFYLGSQIDKEADGHPSPFAVGDNNTGDNDEDGVFMSPFIAPGQSVPITIIASAAGAVNAWLDFDANGSWADAGERIITAMPVNAGANSFTINVPAGAKIGPTYARFRFSSVGQLSYNDSAPDGEVEDYVLEIKEQQNGSIKVIKEATPEDNTKFWMYATIKNAFFNLYCIPLSDPSINSFVFLNPGDISEISESSVPGWTLDGINITGDADNGSTINLTTGTVTLDMDPGENIVLTFRNHKNDDNPPPPVKWPQIPKKKGDSDHPDFFWGWDEPSVYSQVIAADDWYSGDERPVTDIHWWGSYQEWLMETPPVTAPEQFHISIWTDVPGGVNELWSHPGSLVWEILVDRNRLNERRVGSDFYPPKMQEPEACFRYDFLLPPGSWFYPQSNTVYWISIDAIYQSLPDRYLWGWKTVEHYFQDDAVSITAPSAPVLGDVFQSGQPIGGRWDLAFMLTSDQPSQDYDFGDAPDSHGSPHYPTMHANGGAYHTVNPDFCLGVSIDTDVDGQPDSNAMGDDNDGNDDEDGVQLPSTMRAGQTVSITVTASDQGLLNAWIDYNQNQDWSDIGEHIFTDESVKSGPNNLNFNVPADALTGKTYARFRLSRSPGVSFMGWGKEGEVEDYEITFESGENQERPVKWSQPPLYDPMLDDTTFYWGWNETSVYSQSFLADDWFCHDPRPVTSIRWWGAYAKWDSLFSPPDAPASFQIGVWTDVSDDLETGFSHPDQMVREWLVSRNAVNETIDKTYFFNEFMEEPAPCFRYTFTIPQSDWFVQEGDSTVYWLSIAPVYETLPDSNFWGWLTREHYFNDDAVRVMQPAEPHPGDAYENGVMVSDFRDFAFELGTDEYESIYDFGDAPDLGYGTTLERNGPQHLFDPGVRLGAAIDSEPDGQPRADARGDDDNGSADEDGVVFLNDLIPGETAGIRVTTSTAGYLNAWIDFHGDAKWNWPFDFVFTDLELEAGTHVLEFPVPENASIGNTMARFRFSTWPKVFFRGYAGDGEVEDYQVTIGTPSDVERSDAVPQNYKLYQNYPNPFNPRTSIGFEIPATGSQRMTVQLDIYNLRGQRIRTLVHDERAPGHYQVEWEGFDDAGKQVSTGIYLLRMKAGEFIQTKKLLLQK